MKKVQELMMKYRMWMVGIAGVFFIWFFFFRGSDGLTQKEFEEHLKENSNGKIVVTEAKVEPYPNSKRSLYTAKWNGFLISANVDENGKMELPYGILTGPAGLLDEIALGQYQELMQGLSKMADPTLSQEEFERLILNDLNFNNQLMTGQEHTTSKNDLTYRLDGGGGPTTILTFLVTDKKE